MNKILEDVAAQWYDRPGTLRQCTEWVFNFLIKLKEHNPAAFGAWYEPAKTKKQALERKVDFTYEGVRKLLITCVRKGDLYTLTADGKQQLEEGSVASIIERCQDNVYTNLVYNVNIWDGLDGVESSDISISLGSEYGNRYWSENCIIFLPKAGPTHDYYQIPAHQQALIQLLQDCWKPDYIEVNGEKIENIQNTSTAP